MGNMMPAGCCICMQQQSCHAFQVQSIQVRCDQHWAVLRDGA